MSMVPGARAARSVADCRPTTAVSTRLSTGLTSQTASVGSMNASSAQPLGAPGQTPGGWCESAVLQMCRLNRAAMSSRNMLNGAGTAGMVGMPRAGCGQSIGA